MKYRKNNGEIYEGPVCVLPDGRIISGETYTRDSVRVHPIEVVKPPKVTEEQIVKAVKTTRKTKSKKHGKD